MCLIYFFGFEKPAGEILGLKTRGPEAILSRAQCQKYPILAEKVKA